GRLARSPFGSAREFEVSTRPPERLGDDAIWDRAESMLKRALERKQIPYRVDEGGGAFYGPKIDIKFPERIGPRVPCCARSRDLHVRDPLARRWQRPPIQLDFNLPERFELEYTGADNRPH